MRAPLMGRGGCRGAPCGWGGQGCRCREGVGEGGRGVAGVGVGAVAGVLADGWSLCGLS